MGRYSFPPGEVAQTIANALSIRTGKPIDRDQVVVEPYDNIAGQYLATVYESPKVVSRVIPFLDKDGSIPTSIGNLCLVGYRTNRKPATLDLRQHGQVIGGTTSGKTSLLHVMLAHATRCPDCFIWIGGEWKLYDFVSSWVEPYLGTGLKPPIDWITHGHQHVCDMIAGFLDVASYRMNLRLGQRGGLPTGILILDEVTYITNNRLYRIPHNGEEKNASRLIADVARGTAKAKQYMWLATQRDTMDNLGDDGGTTAAQMGFAFVFRIRDRGSLGRVLGDEMYNLKMPTSRGECWADLGPDTAMAKLRIPYPQTPDPGDPLLHDGPKLDEIAWARRHIPHELDAGSAQAAGPAYANRYQLVTNEYIDYLRTEPETTATAPSTSIVMPGIGAIGQSELMEAESIYRKMVQANLPDTPEPTGTEDGSAPAPAPAPVPASVPVENNGVVDINYQPRTVRVLNICQEPSSRSEIITKLEEQGDTITDPQIVTNICSKYCKSSPPKMGRTDDGRYYTL